MNSDEILNKYCDIFNHTDDTELRSAVYDAVFDYLEYKVADMRLEKMRIKSVLKSMEGILDNEEDC